MSTRPTTPASPENTPKTYTRSAGNAFSSNAHTTTTSYNQNGGGQRAGFGWRQIFEIRKPRNAKPEDPFPTEYVVLLPSFHQHPHSKRMVPMHVMPVHSLSAGSKGPFSKVPCTLRQCRWCAQRDAGNPRVGRTYDMITLRVLHISLWLRQADLDDEGRPRTDSKGNLYTSFHQMKTPKERERAIAMCQNGEWDEGLGRALTMDDLTEGVVKAWRIPAPTFEQKIVPLTRSLANRCRCGNALEVVSLQCPECHVELIDTTTMTLEAIAAARVKEITCSGCNTTSVPYAQVQCSSESCPHEVGDFRGIPMDPYDTVLRVTKSGKDKNVEISVEPFEWIGKARTTCQLKPRPPLRDDRPFLRVGVKRVKVTDPVSGEVTEYEAPRFYDRLEEQIEATKLDFDKMFAEQKGDWEKFAQDKPADPQKKQETRPDPRAQPARAVHHAARDEDEDLGY